MARYPLVLLCGVVAFAACGTSSNNNTATGPTAATIAVQPNDLPLGMKQCDLTGDIGNFVAREQTPDPQAAKSISDEWQQAKKDGATAAYAALYTDSTDHCTEIKGSGADPSTATYKLAVNFVVQYKDEKTAAGVYKGQQPILGFNPNELRTGGGGVQEGTKTGLTENSIVLAQPVGNQLFYIAIWQNKSFVVILAVLNVDVVAAKNVAVRENSRIK
jgi:hypothetical protein